MMSRLVSAIEKRSRRLQSAGEEADTLSAARIQVRARAARPSPAWLAILTISVTLLAISHGAQAQQVDSAANPDEPATLVGRIVDGDNEPLAARLYIQSAKGSFHTLDVERFASDHAGAEAAVYHVDRGESVEIHTALSAHPFRLELPPGEYRVTAMRGKEFLPDSRTITLRGGEERRIELQLTRWISMAERGWFSGDTHVHMPIDRCRVAQRAEDLNVAIPLTYWVTDTQQTPLRHNRAEPPRSPELIEVGPDSVIWPVNTEYEIFSVGGQQHTLGAFFAINHRHPLDLSVPPLAPAVAEARAQGALFDLDKHNWPWSMVLPPVIGIDLYELSNNHVWQTEFLFGDWYPEYIADWMEIELDDQGHYGERGWLEFGFRNYYALLNCGLRISPTAGTATGVHPVPIGFGRVYVHLPDGFGYSEWIAGLKAGHSFVTTGPLLDVRLEGQLPGDELALEAPRSLELAGWIESPHPIRLVELLVDGEVVDQWRPDSTKQELGTYRASLARDVTPERSGWIAVRCWEDRADARPRFAHTAPFWISIADRPQSARRVEVEYLLRRVTDELTRSRDRLEPAAIEEFERAATFYRQRLESARDE
ncbi:MAG: CehA/McbA family metallohydrolase [Pirellulaceae bacterium]|nr:carboxypeptidase regulatory-like domain-containing protein [Planctomycetales bacterium]